MPWYYDLNKEHDNKYLRFVRSIYKPLGFHRGYNFPLWFILGGAMVGFGGFRAHYLDINAFAKTKIVNGDWYYWQSGYEHVGIIMHLAAVIPICFLVPWQFLPGIRKYAMWFHRINGYLMVILLLLANASAFMIMRHAMGGDVITQTLLGFLGIYTTVSLVLSYINVKLLQIDQHRAWMLRAWIAAAAVITQRIIQIPAYQTMSSLGTYYFPLPCKVITFITTNIAQRDLASRYPTCRADPTNGWAAVNVNFNGTPEEIGVCINASFALSAFVAFVLHIAGTEIYLALTTAERERLKQVSYEKQVARGWMKRAGDVGLTPNNWGDLPPWYPNQETGRKERDLSPSGLVLSGDESEDSMAKERDPQNIV